ncbi:TPA: Rha family transcriptional regulator, partial [Clostridioides difficile]|nr:Rha family transcriptional regulator [Clostridioides difficile]
MKNLTIIKQNNQFLVESREVAELIEKKHDNLLRDIRGYKKILEDSSNLKSQDFFIESTYINTQNKIQPCYLLTKKGCDMVANKMTGEKGIIFTAIYVTKFEEMERELKEQQPK